jgi:quercetin dioxygenase-like cupin family protein
MGSTFRCVEFAPEDPEVMKTLDGKSAFSEMGAGANIVENARHPFTHRTDSLDYAIVLTGEIWMMMDEEEDDLLLKAGDVLIQRGNNHAWSNRGTETCIIAFVLIDGVSQRDAPEDKRKGIHR